MNILVLGKNGQVGWELQRTLAPLGNIVALGREELDLCKYAEIRRTIRQNQPDIIVNAAAYTAVDKAEEQPELAMTVNGIAPGIMAEEAARLNACLVHYSTDYIFCGTKNSPYNEEDKANPVNAYGKTKLMGEEAIRKTDADHLILRTGWIYGARGINFFLTMLKLIRERDQLTIVNDQYGAPTWCRMIAEATAQLLAQDMGKKDVRKTYHLSAAGQTSWYGFAVAIKEKIQLKEAVSCDIKPIPTELYKTQAQRPLYSVLSSGKIKNESGLSLPDWKESLTMFTNGLF